MAPAPPHLRWRSQPRFAGTQSTAPRIDSAAPPREHRASSEEGAAWRRRGERWGLCLVVGAGDGLGAAIARGFAREGLTVCVTRRPRHLDKVEALARSIRESGDAALAFGLDARVEADVGALVERIEREVGPLEVVIFNIGANVRFPVVETTTQVYSKVWEMACLAGFLTGREAARAMTPRGRGTILFTGATASLRGGAGFSAFAGAKHGLRALAQSLARESGPKGVHVAHVVIDGMIDGDFIRSTGSRRRTAPRARRDSAARGNRAQLRLAPPAGAQRLDVRTRPAALDGNVVNRDDWTH